MRSEIYKILGLCFLLLAGACKKDKTAQPTGATNAPPNATPGERKVYVVCEGKYGDGNASLYMQTLPGNTLYENVYLNVNGKLMGDVFQSMKRIDDRLFLCINNSNKILVIDAVSREYIGTINIPQPRYILPVNPEKAYVSTLYSNKVYIINPKTLQQTGVIEMPAQNPEGMMIQGSRAYICTWDTSCNKVYIVSIVTDKVTDSFKISGYAPHSVLEDRDGAVWVLSGNVEKKKDAALTKLAPGSPDIIRSYRFGPLQDPVKPIFNKAGNTLYFIGVDYKGTTGYNGIFKMDVAANSLPSTPFIPAQKYQYYWALGVDPVTDEIYIGDPKGFTQKGTVLVYDAAGQHKRSFNVGVGPGSFFFD